MSQPAPTPQFIQLHHSSAQHVRQELLQGLTAPVAHVSPKYLYDELGSKLFEAITCLPEYYPTRTEAHIVSRCLPQMAQQVPKGSVFIDLGAGNCQKASRLFEAFQPAQYVAVDISVEFLKDALACLQRQHPHLPMAGVGMDFSTQLQWPQALNCPPEQPRVLFYPGSSIGNFTPEAALQFLKQVHALCSQAHQGGLLIGVDLEKDTRTLELAYDDPLGVTAAFNRNMLLHFNRLAGTNFDLADWKHIGLYNTAQHRIEMHLEALRNTVVQWPEGQRVFKQGERMHTENSYKWTIPSFEQLLLQAGFEHTTAYTDEQGWFALFYAQVRNPAMMSSRSAVK